ncbi:MAG: hypothetical protein ACRDZY_15740, partial [Acidimicrobiales bacterium]
MSGGGWHTLAISPTILAGNTTYWIVYNASGSNDNLYYIGNGGGYAAYTGTVPFGAMPGTWPGSAGYGAPGYLLSATIAGIPGSSLGPPGRNGTQDTGGNQNVISASPLSVGQAGATVNGLAVNLT